MFKKVLVANRGEIAVRVMQTLTQMGIRTVAVYSQPDRAALHAAAADEAYPLHGTTAAETYLRGDHILAIAREHGCEAIHPGYGFLSENEDFAQACIDAGVAFIGPKPSAILSMGDKVLAKQTMAKAGVPIVPGWSGAMDTPIEAIRAEAERVGFPLLVKAAAGGGGKGMRLVKDEYELGAALEAAGREALAAFGDGRVFLEKYIARPRHVEFQIFGDNQGHAVHLFERECSIQRRYQKIIEETPSPVLTPALRQQMGEAAVKAARAIGYTSAGTVEFLVDDKGAFYFLEVNTRLQVEHPITEVTLGQDLVRAQVLVAAGEPLPFTQETLRPSGHAIECRVCAEDAANNFMPSIGTLHRYRPPAGPNIRVDSGVAEGSTVSVYYDPMLAKLIVWGRDRGEAIERTLWALRNFVVLGVTTNIEYLQRVVDHPEFRAGRIHTHFLDEHPSLREAAAAPDEAAVVAAWAAQFSGNGRAANGGGSRMEAASPWAGSGWRAF